MEYPEGVQGYQHVLLSAFKYNLPSIDNKRNDGDKGAGIWTAYLYIPNDLQDSVSSSWNPEKISATGQGLSSVMGNSGAGKGGFDKTLEVGKGAFQDVLMGVDTIAAGTIANANANQGAFAGQILRPNDVLVMSGVGNNSISFNWTMSARNRTEAQNIKDIIYNFKRAARPSLPSADAMILEYPPLIDVFVSTQVGSVGQPQSRKVHEGNVLSYNNMIMESFSVTYGGGTNEALFYLDGNPVTVNISVSLKSIRPGYYADTDGGQR